MPPRRDTGFVFPPEITQLIQQQNALMQVLVQNQGNNNNNNPPPPPVDHLARFLRLNPPVFSSSTEPIVADDWLRKVGRELTTAGCTDAERVHFATHQLDGLAASWWDNYTATHPIDTVTSDQFQQAFRTAHVSAGAMAMKKREFRNLRQGGRTVGQYVEDFSKLARYAPDDVATDAAKQEKFLEGLNDELSMQLMVATFNSYQELIDHALMIEEKQQHIENRKRKYGQGKYNSGAQQKPRFTPRPGGHFQHTHGGGSSHNHNGTKNGNGNGGSNGQNRTNPRPQPGRT